ncbi:hypothetical protein [Frigoribacterium salinisoli]
MLPTDVALRAPATGDQSSCPDLFDLFEGVPTTAVFACDGVCDDYEGALSLFEDRIELGCGTPRSIAFVDVEAWWATVVGAAVTVTVQARGAHSTTLPSAYRAALLVALDAQLGPERVRA